MENSKIDEQHYNNDSQTLDEKLLDVQLQNAKQVNSTYYVSAKLSIFLINLCETSLTKIIKKKNG